MVEKLRSYDEEPLPQDLQEGVDDDEWVSKKLHFFPYNLNYEEMGGKDSKLCDNTTGRDFLPQLIVFS